MARGRQDVGARGAALCRLGAPPLSASAARAPTVPPSKKTRVSSRMCRLGVAFAPVQRKLAVDLVRRGCEARRLFAGNNSHSCVGGLGKQLPKLPGALVRVISGRQWPRNGFPSDTFSINTHSIYARSPIVSIASIVLSISIAAPPSSPASCSRWASFCSPSFGPSTGLASGGLGERESG